MNRFEKNYKRLLPYIEDMIGTAKSYKRFTALGFMPLVIERLTTKDDDGCYIFSISHYYVQNGDLMADPDMTVKVNPEHKTVEALTYQQDAFGIYQEVYFIQSGKTYVRPKLRQELNAFLEHWLVNIKNQGYKLEEK